MNAQYSGTVTHYSRDPAAHEDFGEIQPTGPTAAPVHVSGALLRHAGADRVGAMVSLEIGTDGPLTSAVNIRKLGK
jgi:hypothetical protein